MPDDRGPRPSFRDRHQDRHGTRPGSAPPRPGFSPRPSGPPPRAPFPPRPADIVTVRLRDGDREVEVHGPITACRQLLDDLPALWPRLRPHATGAAQPSISLPQPPRTPDPAAEAAAAPAVEPAPSPAPQREGHRRNRHETEDRRPALERSAADAPVQAARRNGAATTLDEQVIAVLRAARKPVGIAEIRGRLDEEVSAQAVRRILERAENVTNVGGRPAAYRLR